VGARLGQHFLFDPSILRRIAARCVAGPDEEVVEIGAGKGTLTMALAALARRVVAIETDAALAAALAAACRGSNVTVVHGDALEIAWPRADVICGNIPYRITSPLIEKALRPPRPARVVFLVQREVGDRLAAAPGEPSYGALSAGVQLVATVRRLFRVPAGAFRPRPGVDSALILLEPRATPLAAGPLERRARHVIRACFQRRRQQLRRILRDAWGVERGDAERRLAALGIGPDWRPERLAPEQFVALARALGSSLPS
jgi:16S rRNA (adenine1518-N6/adenine1519-N6)-dimethyltransferase